MYAHAAFWVVNLVFDLGLNLQAMAHTDASAVLAIIQRRGVGKFRHIEVQWLWVREKVTNCFIKITKIVGKTNVVDLFAKHLPTADVTQHLAIMNFNVHLDRADKSLTINQFIRPIGSDHLQTGSQCIMTVHVQPRRCLFTFFRSRGAPQFKFLTSIRVTHGVFIDIGEGFIKHGNWTQRMGQTIDFGRALGWPHCVPDGIYHNRAIL